MPSTRSTASIYLVYAGDAYGCNLQISVTVGSRTVQPSGNRFQMRSVPTGEQDYSISGPIVCPTIGTCRASGTGSIDVADGRSYYVVWRNTSVGVCGIGLQE